MTSFFTASGVRHLKSSVITVQPHSASESDKGFKTSFKQLGAHISAANVPIALSAPCRAKAAA